MGERPKIPRPESLPEQLPDRIYMIAVAGTGMGALAAVLRDRGIAVSGSDKAAWEPMGSMLERAGVRLLQPYDADNVPKDAPLIIVGNAVGKDHPEVRRVRELGLPWLSMAEAVEHYIAPERDLYVAAGTHGKTTSSALLAHLLAQTGVQPGYLIGGQPENFDLPGAWGDNKAPFVIEGDEYSTSFADFGPKLWHYPATAAVIPSLEYDHADLYDSAEAYYEAFARWLKHLPADTALYAAAGWPMAHRLAKEFPKRIRFLGRRRKDPIAIHNVFWQSDAWHFELHLQGTYAGDFVFPMAGEANLNNASLCLTLLIEAGYDANVLARGCASFLGVRKRQTVLAANDTHIVILDFGHHPTEIRATIDAVRQRWEGKPLTVVFEPRSFSARRRTHQAGFARAFDKADHLLLAPVFNDTLLADQERLDTSSIAAGHHAGQACTSLSELEERLQSADNGVYLFFSNGAFDNLPQRFAAHFSEGKKV